MAWLDFWDYFFNQLSILVSFLKNTPAVYWSDNGVTYSISWFAVLVSFLLTCLFIDVVFFFVHHASGVASLGDDDDDD